MLPFDSQLLMMGCSVEKRLRLSERRPGSLGCWLSGIAQSDGPPTPDIQSLKPTPWSVLIGMTSDKHFTPSGST